MCFPIVLVHSLFPALHPHPTPSDHRYISKGRKEVENGRANVEEGRLHKEAGRIVKEKSRKGRAASKKEKEDLRKDSGAPKAAKIFTKPLLPAEGAEKMKAKIDQYKKVLEAAKGSIKEAKSGGSDLKKASLLKDAGKKIKAKAKHVRDIGRDMIDAGNALKGEGRKLLSNGDKCVLLSFHFMFSKFDLFL